MPIPNIPQTAWNGYLIEGLSGQGEKVIGNLENFIKSRKLPKVTTTRQRVNIWSYSDKLCLDITSQTDGYIYCTVHVLDYGTALFVGVAFASKEGVVYVPVHSLGNYYKQMAAAVFKEAVSHCVIEAINKTANTLAKEKLEIKEIGKI